MYREYEEYDDVKWRGPIRKEKSRVSKAFSWLSQSWL